MQHLTERIIAHFMESLDRSVFHKMPFAHWILSDVLPTQVLDSAIEIPFSPLPVDFLQGYQRSAIERRLFFSTENFLRQTHHQKKLSFFRINIRCRKPTNFTTTNAVPHRPANFNIFLKIRIFQLFFTRKNYSKIGRKFFA